MYIKITDRCNMRCDHCGPACTDKGMDMSMKTFEKVVEMSRQDSLSIGGGEPTEHPLFWKMLIHALVEHEDDYGGPVWLATNGKNTQSGLKLAKLAKKGAIAVALSLDKWHEPISQEVVRAFKDGMSKNRFGMYESGVRGDLREIRTVSRIVDVGRAKANKIGNCDDVCICENCQVEPNGDLKLCGCPSSPKVCNINDITSEQFYDILDVLGTRDFSYSGCWNIEVKRQGKSEMQEMLEEIGAILEPKGSKPAVSPAETGKATPAGVAEGRPKAGLVFEHCQTILPGSRSIGTLLFMSEASGEAGDGVYAYPVDDNAMNMRNCYSGKGESVFRLSMKAGAVVADLTEPPVMKDLLAYARKRFKQNKKTMPHYTVPQVHERNIQRFGAVVSDFVKLRFPEASGYIVPHCGSGLPSGKQAVITAPDSFDVELVRGPSTDSGNGVDLLAASPGAM